MGCTVTVTASFQPSLNMDDVTGELTIQTTDVNEAPIFHHGDSQNAEVLEDAPVSTRLANISAFDPDYDDNKPEHEITYEIVPDSAIAGIVTRDGDHLVLTGSPAENNVKPGVYNVLVRATSRGDDASRTMTSEHTVRLKVGRSNTGPQANNDQTGAESKGDDKASSASLAGIIVGVLVAIVLIALVIAIVYKRSQDKRAPESPLYEAVSDKHFDNPTFVPAADGAAFVPGLSNPLYQWYSPDLNRNDATQQLAEQPDGAFVVRDSKATPGWHILGVKRGDAVLHEKIRMDEEGLYELLPSNGQPQPAFHSLPDLVLYYGAQRDVPYSLNVDAYYNPMYDAFEQQRLGQSDQYAFSAWTRDEDAPVVPLKMRDIDAVAQVAAHEDDIYTNTNEAMAVLSNA